MKVSEIEAVGGLVHQLAKPNSHLHNFPPDALDVMQAWGFRYVTITRR
ncbi:MAG TPA: hypothetical protein VMK42_05175 [Anaeromyxobacteraceae bacterium]|nr:hypothetical protein [Anaeromyxobacteraceae bacterium]